MHQIFILFILLILTVALLLTSVIFILLFRPWLRAFMHGTPVALVQIVGMRLRGNPTRLLIDAYITLKRAGFPITIAEVENAYIDYKSRIFGSDDLVELIEQDANNG